jgi:hypothetical protein
LGSSSHCAPVRRIYNTPFSTARVSCRGIPARRAVPSCRINRVAAERDIRLKWDDIDFERGTMSVIRSIVYGVVGPCKTESSQKPVPMHPTLADALMQWSKRCTYIKPEDWVFASKRYRGQRPYWGQAILRKYIRPAAQRVRIQKRFGWHTFRPSYSTLLRSVGTEFKVMQELHEGGTLRGEPGDRRDVPRAFSQKVKENKCNVPSVPGLLSLRRPPLGFRKGPALLYVQTSRMTIIKTPTSYFACASFVTTAATLSSIWFQPSI